MLTIYGTKLSNRVQKVMMTAELLGYEYTIKEVDIAKGETQTPEYLAKHPAGKVPVFEDEDGFVLFESNAMSKYLVKKMQSDLYPADLKEQGLVDQWCDFASLHIDIHAASLGFNLVIAPMIGAQVDQMSLEEKPKFLKRFIDVVDKQLGKTKYIAGDTMTIADISLLAATDPFEAINFDFSEFTHFKTWREELQSQDFYKATHA